MMWLLKACLVTIAVLFAAACFLIPLYLSGYVSRGLVVAASPDGSMEAVCRGWYPHGTEYELWLRRTGEWFGRKLGPVGSESMGRCAAVAWSGDGSRVVASTTGGWVTMWDAKANGVTGVARLDDLVYRGGDGCPYTTPHMVRSIAFDPDDSLRVNTCERLWIRTHRVEDAVSCGSPARTDVVPLRLEPPRGGMLRYAVNQPNRRN